MMELLQQREKLCAVDLKNASPFPCNTQAF